jgi:putative transposase
MPRQARLDAPGTLHHVMIRGIEKSKIFRDDEDREQFLSRVAEVGNATATRILAWCLMDNHVHLLLFSGSSGLPAFMRRLLTGYAVWFNRRHLRRGHLFQNRYKSIVCEEDPYLLELVRYIHLNPLRSRKVGTVQELDKYRWTGHSVLVGKVRRDWQERDYVLHQFGRKHGQSVRDYRRFMEDGKGMGRRADLVGGGLVRSVGGWSKVLSLRNRREEVPHDSRILGSGDFVNSIIREAEGVVSRQMRSRGRESVDEMIRRMCRGSGVEEKEIYSGSRRREVSRVRGEIAYYLIRQMGISMAEAARRLGVGASAIAMTLRRRNASDGHQL